MSRLGARYGAVAWAIGIGVLSLLPADAAVQTGGWDKLEHALAYAGLAILLRQALPPLTMVQVWVFATGYGGLIEAAQIFSPGRHADGLDLLANGIGAMLGLALYALWSNRTRAKP